MSATSEGEAVHAATSGLVEYDSETQHLVTSLAYDNNALKKGFHILLARLAQNVKTA
jgi:hypothetical protein